jgi:hypothetical protein
MFPRELVFNKLRVNNMNYFQTIAVLTLLLNTIAFADRGISIQKQANQNQERRVALVIGNSAYKFSPLKNPVNDASAMGRVLKKNGFDVIQKLNADRRQMEEAIKQFGKKLRRGGIGFFYYAGHGIQMDGRNYLIPSDISVESESDVKYGAVDAGKVLGKMHDAGNSLNVVVMDACRNNPFSRSFRSAEKGLAKMDAPTGTIIAYATSPGSVAADGNETNGLYTKYLLKYLNQPNLKIEDVFKNVRISVVHDSAKKQVPWESSSLIGNFVFNIEKVNIVSNDQNHSIKSALILQNSPEEEYWALIRNSSDPSDFQSYLKEYPKGRYISLAQLKLKKLADNKVSILPGVWEAWHEKQGISQITKLPDGAVQWFYSIPEINDDIDAGIFLAFTKRSLSNKKLHIKLTSKSAFPVNLGIYSFVQGYSKKDDIESHVLGEILLNLKSGTNEFFLDINDFHIPAWWLEKYKKTSIKMDSGDIRGLEFYVEVDDEFTQLSDTLTLHTLEIYP